MSTHVNELILDIAPIWFSWHCLEFMCERDYSQSVVKKKMYSLELLIHKKIETFPRRI